MSMDLFRLASKAAFILCLLIISLLAFAPFEDAPGLSYDKANHLLAFLVLAGLAEMAWPEGSLAPVRLGGLAFYGLAIELVQFFLPYREASGWDLVSDLLGIGLYLAFRRLLPPMLRRLLG